MSFEDFLIETVKNVVGVEIEIWNQAFQHAKSGHPEVSMERVRESLKDPLVVIKSKKSNSACLFYELEFDGSYKVYFCTVVEFFDERKGKMVTAYEADFIKNGTVLYERGKK